MSETLDRYQAIAGGFSARLNGLSEGQWSAATPCPEWTVRDVVSHVVGVHRRINATLDGSTPEEVAPDADLLAEWPAATSAVAESLADEERASKVVNSAFGDQPFESMVGRLLCGDTLVHTWDIARATGQDETLDPHAVAKCIEFLGPIDEAIRRPGGFGPKIDPAQAEDEQTKLLNFCGRRV